MSKIDEYNKIKNDNQNAIEKLHLSLGRDGKGVPDSNNDKGCIRFYDQNIWDTDMKISIHSCYGYYGSSSAYSIGNPTIKSYLLRSLNKNHQLIVEDTIKMLQDDIEKARKSAEKEAQEILELVNK